MALKCAAVAACGRRRSFFDLPLGDHPSRTTPQGVAIRTKPLVRIKCPLKLTDSDRCADLRPTAITFQRIAADLAFGDVLRHATGADAYVSGKIALAHRLCGDGHFRLNFTRSLV